MNASLTGTAALARAASRAAGTPARRFSASPTSTVSCTSKASASASPSVGFWLSYEAGTSSYARRIRSSLPIAIRGCPPFFIVSMARFSMSALSRALPVISTLSPALTIAAATIFVATALRSAAGAAPAFAPASDAPAAGVPASLQPTSRRTPAPAAIFVRNDRDDIGSPGSPGGASWWKPL